MKNILKQTLILASIMIFVVFFVSYLMIGITQEIALVFELFLLSFLIVLIQQLIKRAYFNQCFLNIVMEYLTISISVLLYGYFVDWFVKSNWWMVFLYVAIVYKSFVFDVLRVRLLLSGNDKVSVRLPVQEIPFSKDLRQRQFDDSGNPRS